MSIRVLILSLVFQLNLGFSQAGWTWFEMDTMPMRVSNNAVTYGSITSEFYAYSFGGIDETKIYSGITRRSFRYHVATNSWEEIDSLPNTLPTIASAASNVKNKIYIIGGYHVTSTGSEISSDEVIIYNPETNLYEANGASVPTPIDDHVQCVWRDSLIFVITGWSNTTNVPYVQIYDPALDQWQAGSEVPNNTSYKVFGGSGHIIGDTIYYFGGASTGWNFPATDKLRKGLINPNDPTQITWTLEETGPNKGYRQACLNYGTKLYWLGGSSTSYNYDGIAYNGTGGVDPLYQIMRYEAYHHWWDSGSGAPFGVMDLRGIARVSLVDWIICGGMSSGQEVSNKTYLLSLDPLIAETTDSQLDFWIDNGEIRSPNQLDQVSVYSIEGKLLQQMHESFILHSEIRGPVIIELVSGDRVSRKKFLL